MSSDLNAALLEESGDLEGAEQVRAGLAVVDAEGRVVPLCKRDGCHEAREDSRGRYAGLCVRHKNAAIEANRQDGVFAGAGKAASEARRADAAAKPVESLAPLVRALQKPAQRFERALASRKAVNRDAADATREFNEALTAIKDAANALINDASSRVAAE